MVLWVKAKALRQAFSLLVAAEMKVQASWAFPVLPYKCETGHVLSAHSLKDACNFHEGDVIQRNVLPSQVP